MPHTAVVDASDGAGDSENASSERHVKRRSGKTSGADEPAFSLYDMFGWISLTILCAGSLVLVASLSFLWFLWLANDDNSTWRNIAIENWVTRAVTLTSVAIRYCFDLPASMAASMLAALFLENIQALLVDFAAISAIRSSNDGPYELLWYALRSFWRDQNRWSRTLLPILILLLAVTTFLSQFTSTVLTSDLRPGDIPGRSQSSLVKTNFDYSKHESKLPIITQGTVWGSKVDSFPAFAEYQEPVRNTTADIADTGLTLRAFLPLSNQQSRSNIYSFSGKATIGDFSVRCESPRLSNERAHYAAQGLIGLTGKWNLIKNRQRAFQGLVRMPYDDEKTVTPNIPLPLSIVSQGLFSKKDIDYERPSVFGPVRPSWLGSSSLGRVYLAVKVSEGSIQEWKNVIGYDTSESGTFGNPGISSKRRTKRGEWLDLDFAGDGSVVLSVSICYAFYDLAILRVDALGKSKRQEPTLSYSLNTQSFDFSDVRRQLGQPGTGGEATSLDNRGILSLQRTNSLMPPIGKNWRPFWIQWLLCMEYNVWWTILPGYFGYDYNYTALLSGAGNRVNAWSHVKRVEADPSTAALAQDILKTGGSMAFALQSILTVLTATAFYDQLPLFDDFNTITTSLFDIVIIPIRKRGLIAVTTVAIFHFALILCIILLFVKRTAVSTIGNAWHATSQTLQCAPAELIENSALKTDKQLEKSVTIAHVKKTEYCGVEKGQAAEEAQRIPNLKKTFLGLRRCTEDRTKIVPVPLLYTRHVEKVAREVLNRNQEGSSSK